MTSRKNASGRGRVLVTGADGLLGRQIFHSFSDVYDVMPTDLNECDVTRPEECMGIIGRFRPDVVVHCAAYTAVDRAEREEEVAFRINAGGTRNVALACRRHRALLVTFGTDYVFDGTSDRPYEEDDPTGPLSAYGRSKLAAEDAVHELAPEFLLLRTQWLFGPHGRNFASSILDRARKGEDLRVVSDQRGSPTYSLDLAEAVKQLLEARARGVYHFSNEGETTFFEYAAFLLSHAGMGRAPLVPVSTKDLPPDAYPAPRPLYAVLSKSRYREKTGVLPRIWEEAVLDFLQVRGEDGKA